jgi:salicylate hydroxylase
VLYVGAGRSLIHYPLRRQTTMNLLGNAQAAEWQAEGWAIPATVEEFLGLFDDFPEPVQELIAAIPALDLFKWGLRDREPLEVWTRGRVTMLGDAAHPMTPYLGQGACMAIEDGMILGRALAGSQDLQEAFSRYEAGRRIAPTASSWPPATRERNITARPLPVPVPGRPPRRSACSRTTR